MSQVTERLWQEYEAFATRDLSEFAVAYLFVDGVAERLHAGMPREAVLCAWGITEEGRKVLLHGPGHEGGHGELYGLLRGPEAQRAADPLLVVTDGAPGLIRAVDSPLPAGPPPTMSRPSNAESARQGAGGDVARPWRSGLGPATRRPRQPWPPSCATTSSRSTSVTSPPRSDASSTTSRRASRTCASRCGIVRWFGPRISWSDCSSKSGVERRSSRTPSANGPS